MKAKLGNKEVEVSMDAVDLQLIRVRTPYKTGLLSSSFDINTDGDIENPVDYADEVEFGTSTRPGRFMVTLAANEIGERLGEKIARALEDQDIFPPIIINI